MDLEASLWFLTVVQCGTFSQASQELKVPVSTLSRRISQLEKQCNTQLLIRNTRHLRLTAAGAEFIEVAKTLSASANQLQNWRDSQSGVCGVLKMTAPIQFIDWPLTDWLIEFKLLYPKIKIEVSGSNDYLDFYEHHIDIGFRQGPLPDSDMRQRRLFSLQYGMFVSATWKTAYQGDEDLTWLASQQAINIGAKGRAFPWLLKQKEQLVPYYPNAELLLESPKQAIKAAVAGVGVAYTSCFDAHEALSKTLIKPVCLHLWPGWIDFFVVYQESHLKSKKLAAFIDFVFAKQHELNELYGVKTK